jgi:peroxiredoxin
LKFLQPIGARFFYLLLLMIGLGWIWFSAMPAGSAEGGRMASPQSGFFAPDFTLKTLEGQTVKLSDLRGKVILVNIWASWCPPCKAEMPALEHVYQKYKDRDFVVLAVNSTVQDTAANAQAFVSQNNLTFPILIDESGLVTQLYRVQSLPTSFFIGADGVISEVIIGGPMAEALLISRVEALLQAAP